MRAPSFLRRMRFFVWSLLAGTVACPCKPWAHLEAPSLISESFPRGCVSRALPGTLGTPELPQLCAAVCLGPALQPLGSGSSAQILWVLLGPCPCAAVWSPPRAASQAAVGFSTHFLSLRGHCPSMPDGPCLRLFYMSSLSF